MARNNKESKRILIILLIIFILVSAFSFIYYEYQYKIIKKEVKDESSLKVYDDEITNDNNRIQEINEEIQKINNINIENTKQECYKEIKKLEDRILDGKSKAKIAYLTFDDGPYYRTYKFLDTLDKYKIKATFFTTNVNGTYCWDNSDYNCHALYKEYAKRGHTIANHTYTHAIFKGLYSSKNSFIQAVKDQEKLVKEETGYTTRILRFPGGSATAGSLKSSIVEELRKMGYGYVDWTASVGDGGKLASSDKAYSNFVNSINEKIEVVLMHDYSKKTLDALPREIEYLNKNGYLILPLFYESTMIKK